MAHNISRAARMRTLSNSQLLAIATGGTLAASAARFELRRRDLVAVRTRSGWHLAPAEVPDPRHP